MHERISFISIFLHLGFLLLLLLPLLHLLLHMLLLLLLHLLFPLASPVGAPRGEGAALPLHSREESTKQVAPIHYEEMDKI